MADFNPDDFLAKYGSKSSPEPIMPKPNKGFDPDEFLAKYAEPEPQKSDWDLSLKGLGRGAIKALPMAGGLLGGFAGTALGPLGAVGGAGLGAAGGEALKQGLEQQFGLEESPGLKKNLEDIGYQGLLGSTGEAGGMVAAKAIGAAPKLLGRFAKEQKGNAKEITGAAERVGIKPTEGMLTKNRDLQILEDTLATSPTIAGHNVRKSISQAKEGVQKAGETIFKERVPGDPFEMGEAIKSEITSKIGEKLAPLKMNYDELANAYQNSPINKKSITKTAKGLRNLAIAEFPNTESGAIVHRYAEMMEQAKSASSLRTLETEAQRAMRAAKQSGDYNKVNAYSEVIGALKRSQQSHIIRSAVESMPKGAKGAKAGMDIAQGVIQQLKDTNKGYRALMKEIEVIAGSTKIKAKSPTQFLDALEDIPSEEISKRMFNTKNYAGLQAIKESLPDQFEMLRKSKLADIAKKSESGKQVFDVAKFLKQVEGMGKGEREIIFGKESDQLIKDLRTLYNSTPEIFNTSRTSAGMDWQSLFSPSYYPKEAFDAFKYMVYKSKGKTIPGLIEAGEKLKAPAGLGAGAGLLMKGRD